VEKSEELNETETTDEKICPLFAMMTENSLGWNLFKEWEDGRWVINYPYCIRERCAFWSRKRGRCGLVR